MRYYPGDHVGIYPANRKQLVDGILERMKSTCPDPDKTFQVELRKTVQTLEGKFVIVSRKNIIRETQIYGRSFIFTMVLTGNHRCSKIAFDDLKQLI